MQNKRLIILKEFLGLLRTFKDFSGLENVTSIFKDFPQSVQTLQIVDSLNICYGCINIKNKTKK